MTERLTVAQTADGRPAIISAAQHAMLTFIRQHPGALYIEVAEHIGFDVPSVTSYASRMERAQLLERKPMRVGNRNRTTLHIRQGVCLDFDVVRI